MLGRSMSRRDAVRVGNRPGISASTVLTVLTAFLLVAIVTIPVPGQARAGAARERSLPPAGGLYVLADSGSASDNRGAAAGDLVGEMTGRQLETLNTSKLEEFIQEVNRELDGYLEPVTLNNILESVRGKTRAFSPLEILKGLGRYFFDQLVGNFGLLGKLIVISVLAAVLRNLQSAFEGETVGKLAYAAVYLVLVVLVTASFYLALQLARGVIKDLVSFMLALLPLLLTLMAGMGALASAGLFHPLMVAMAQTVGVIAADWVFPMIFLAAVLDIVSGFSDSFPLSGLAGLIKQASIGFLGISLAIFLGIVSVQGAAGAVADGVGLRTAKFLAGAFVPVIGGFLSDAAELVIGSSLIIKNALGILGLVFIFLLIVVPLSKIAALVLTYRLAAAIIQPVGGEGVVNLMGSISASLVLVAATAAAVALMFFISLTVMVGMGNVTVMMR